MLTRMKYSSLITIFVFTVLLAACSSEEAATMHPTWDANNDGINDCEDDGSCDHTKDYTKPRPESDDADGETVYNQNSWKIIISDTCLSYFDGCNNCRRTEGSDIAACTRKACAQYEKPTCLDE